MDWLLEWVVRWRIWRDTRRTPAIAWAELHEQIRGELEGYSVFVETRKAEFVPLAAAGHSISKDAVALAIAWIRPDVTPWEMEQPAAALASRLTKTYDVKAQVLISRRLDSFAGYYVSVRP